MSEERLNIQFNKLILNLLKNRLKMLINFGFKPRVFVENHKNSIFCIKYRISYENRNKFDYLCVEFVKKDGIYSVFDQKIAIDLNLKEPYESERFSKLELDFINSNPELKNWLISADVVLKSFKILDENANSNKNIGGQQN